MDNRKGQPAMTCCKVEALVTVDERGQLVLPKDLRERARVKAGDRFVVVSGERDGEVCCLLMLRAGDFAETVKGMLGPMMQEILK
ncbi:MAG: HgcAB-associated protein [Chloroflexota bacterium]